MNPRPLSSPDDGVEEASTMDLVGGLVRDTRELVEAHVGAAKLEIKHELSDVANGIKHAAIAAVLLGVGSILGGIALAQVLIAYTELLPWAAHGIVALCAIAVGVGLALRGKHVAKDADAVPERQIARAAHDARWLAKRAGVAAQPKH